jgi:phi13 family phage major tail protein
MAYVGKPIGARNLTMWPILADGSYGTPQKLSRLIQIQVAPVLMEGTLESDDGVEDDLSLVVAYDVTINASQLTDAVRAALLGQALDTGGGILVTNTDVAQEVAIGWKEELSKQSGPTLFKYVVLYRGKFKEFSETANTKTQGGVTFQTHNLTGRFYARDDGHIRFSIREDTPNADPAKIAAWFATPQEYGEPYAEQAATPTATPPAGAVASGTTVALATTTVGASIYYTLDGSTPTADSPVYLDPIEITTAVTIKAIAIHPGMTPSEVLTAEYTITP